jgi:MFS family permease
MKTRYLTGAVLARGGDEMTGPAVVLLAFAVTGAPGLGSVLMACLTVAAAAGGPAFGAVLDQSRRPERALACALAGYGAGIVTLAAMVGRVPLAAAAAIAVAAGTLSPAVAGGWTSQLPRVVTAAELPRASALDAMSFSAASMAGPALAALITLWLGARVGVAVAAGLVAAAVPAALRLRPDARLTRPGDATHAMGPAGVGQGLAAIVARRALLRVTATSVVSYVGAGMLLVCCPLLGKERLGGSPRGALLISVLALSSLTVNALLARRRASRGDSAGNHKPDRAVFVSTLIIGAGMVMTALAPGWITLLGVAVNGAGEGPQLTALFAVRHREAPERLRGRIFTTAASLKIGGMAVGSALAGPLAGWSVTGCLLVAAAAQACAAGTYLAIRTTSNTSALSTCSNVTTASAK